MPDATGLPDPFGTAARRAAVLAAWTAAPARLREDANAEEDLALGGYRDRLVVELAQNAADAATRAGVPGRLLLRLDDDGLTAANTGAPLDAEAVTGLATLRASGKRDDAASVGRFGVGFAAVLAVTDAPAVVSRHAGGVRFSRAATRAACRDDPALAAELDRRGGHVPALRLPWPATAVPEGAGGSVAPPRTAAAAAVPEGAGGPLGSREPIGAVVVPAGYDTAVRLPWRDADALALGHRLVAEVDAALLLLLPGLAEVVVEAVPDGVRRTLSAARDVTSDVVLATDGAATRWRVRSGSGSLDPALLADRPTEERTRRSWRVTWAVPLADRPAPLPDRPASLPDRPASLPASVPRVLHAPTPTDEPLELPALLVASYPLEPSRRHVAPGALADEVTARAAAVYAGLVRELAEGGVDVAPLVPSPVPAGALDAALRRALRAELAVTPLLPAAEDAALLLRPRDAVVLDAGGAALAAALATAVAGLAGAAWPRAALDAVGVRRIALADVVDELATIARPPAWWHDLYAALDTALRTTGPRAGALREDLGALPVPLADGRTVRGPRGLLLAGGTGPAAGDLAALGLRVVHPAAAHPLLERLGAAPAEPAAVLADPLLVGAVTAGDGAAALAPVVLDLVAASGAGVEALPWLAQLLLPAEDGELWRPAELALPGSPAADVLDDVGVVAAGLVDRVGPEVLERVGVLRTLGLARLADAALDPDELDDLADDLGAGGLADWCEDVLGGLPDRLAGAALPPVAPELLLVRDLDLVRDGAWPQVLELLAVPPLRAAVVDPVRVLLPSGGVTAVPSYAAWALRREARLASAAGPVPPPSARLAGSDPLLAGLYADVSSRADPVLLRAAGVRTSLAELLAEPGGARELLDRILSTEVDAERLRALHAALAAVDPDDVEPRDRVRVTAGAGTRVVAAVDAVVADGPWQLQLAWPAEPLVAPAGRAEALADVLGVDLAGEQAPGEVAEAGTPVAVPGVVHRLLAAANLPDRWYEHEALEVDGTDVEWWVAGGEVHAATVDGLARGLAWVAGAWELRFLVAAVLAQPGRVDALLAEAGFDGRRPLVDRAAGGATGAPRGAGPGAVASGTRLGEAGRSG